MPLLKLIKFKDWSGDGEMILKDSLALLLILQVSVIVKGETLSTLLTWLYTSR